jgi:hypothetical protein
LRNIAEPAPEHTLLTPMIPRRKMNLHKRRATPRKMFTDALIGPDE